MKSSGQTSPSWFTPHTSRRPRAKFPQGFPLTNQTPPTFLVHAEDDKAYVAGSKVYHAALEQAKVSTEFFHCASGGHGHGLRSDKEVGVWPKKCQEWLIKMGLL